MVEITAAMVRKLRDKTDAPMMECKRALTEANGDLAKAEEILRIKLGNKAVRASSRIAAEGVVGTWIATDAKLGAMVEVNCETDFVARTPEFLQFCRDVAMQVAAMSPRFVRAEEIPSTERLGDEERKAACLLEQPFVKDQAATIQELLTSLIAKTGENVVIRRFTRFTLGESAG